MTARNPLGNFVRRQARVERPLGRTDGKWYTVYEDFELLPPVGAAAAGKGTNFSITGTGTVPVPAFAALANGRGGIKLATRTTSAADNDEARLFPFATNARWGQTIGPLANNEFEIEGIVRTDTAITETQIYFGFKLTDTGVVATDANQALFLYDTDNTTSFGPAGTGTLTASANWLAIQSTAGDDVSLTLASPIAVAASTSVAATSMTGEYKFRINVGVDRIARYYINNGLYATGTVALPTTAALIPCMGHASRKGTPALVAATYASLRLSVFVA